MTTTREEQRDVVERLRGAAARLHAGYDKGSPDECWNWKGARTRTGYGRFGVGRYGTTAHRAMMIITHGPIPSDLEVCHRCDNRLCVNPAHLWVGTPKENSQDRVAKGRNVSALGPRNGRSKLTADLVRTIRSSTKPNRVLAREIGIDESRIRQIKKGDGWNDVR